MPNGRKIYFIGAGMQQKQMEKKVMRIWNTPQVREQEVGLEVTSYMSAEIEII